MRRELRNSGIELLRIVCMLQIVYLHVCAYSGYGDIVGGARGLGGDFARLSWSSCRMAVNVFLIISGYFMVRSHKDLASSYRRIPRLWIQLFFYSVTIAAIFWISDPGLLHGARAIRSFFPVFSRSWYFMSLYLLVAAFSPFLNRLLCSLNKRHYLLLLGLCFLTFSIWPSLSYLHPLSDVIGIHKVINTEYGFSLYNFLFMYALGGYLSRFWPKDERPRAKYALAFAAFCLTNYFFNSLSMALGGNYSRLFKNFDNPFMILSAAAMFLFFRGMTFHSRAVNTVAGATLGVYIIHEDPYVRPWLWGLFGADKHAFYAHPTYVLVLFLMVVGVFSVCAAIELLRQQLFREVQSLFVLAVGKARGRAPANSGRLKEAYRRAV